MSSPLINKLMPSNFDGSEFQVCEEASCLRKNNYFGSCYHKLQKISEI
jgi:hypothetical protein